MTFSWPRHPIILEINAWTWLKTLSRETGALVTLATVPDDVLDGLAAWGLHAVWLMGVWERSPEGRRVALEHPDLQAEYAAALPDFSPDDVIGSPYAVRRYEVDPALGGRSALQALRSRLNARGLGLVLDAVPNHVAIDHPWLAEYPACFIQGSAQDLERHPEHFFAGPAGRVFAYGRDPYFPAWTDTAQLNAFHPALRTRAASTMMSIAALCDGVRCDMAMLVTNRVFRQTWGDRAGAVPPTEFWDVVLPAVKTAYPQVIFLAEVYWGLEPLLQQQGFDYTYDKGLYDRLRGESVDSITAHLARDTCAQCHMVRFIENHDEQRATMAFGPGRDLMAAVLVTTLPGATLLHEGQMDGCQVRLPVQLGRRPPEPVNAPVRLFYQMLMAEASHPIYQDGQWVLRRVVPGWSGAETHHDLIAYTWQDGDERRLVVVNFSAVAAQGRVPLPNWGLAGRGWRLADVLHPGQVYERDGDEMARAGLYVELSGWAAHIFRFEPVG